MNADESGIGGNNPQLNVLADVIMRDGTGEEHVLDSVDETLFVDPKGDG